MGGFLKLRAVGRLSRLRAEVVPEDGESLSSHLLLALAKGGVLNWAEVPRR